MDTAFNSLKTILALKLRMRADEIGDSDTIEKLCGGNSARRNEILADIGNEFQVAPLDDAHNQPLTILSQTIVKRTKYDSMGPYLSASIDNILKDKLALTKGKIAEYLQGEWGITNGHASDILKTIALLSREGDSVRAGGLSPIGIRTRLSSQDDANKWIDKALAEYERSAGVSFAKKEATAVSGGGVDPRAIKELEAKFSGVAREFAKISGSSFHEKISEPEDNDKETLTLLRKELGTRFEKVIEPIFNEKKIVSFRSNWAWAKKEMVKLYYEEAGGGKQEDGSRIFERNASEELLKTAEFYKLDDIAEAIKEGLGKKGRFAGKIALVTGAGPNSIASEIVKKFLEEGARVVVATSTYSGERVEFFKKLYQSSCSNGSELYLLPANQGSRRDIEELIKWTVSRFNIPDYLIPFGAVKELGYTADSLGGESSTTLRVLLQGVVWFAGETARAARETNLSCTCVLPLSPNHGEIGGDGFYAETKLALEALINKSTSEYDTLGKYIKFIGARIGWTRGTGLMRANDVVADELEKRFDVKTYTQCEMSDLIVSLLDKPQGIFDLSGGIGRVEGLGKIIKEVKGMPRAESRGGSKACPERSRWVAASEGPKKSDPNIYAFSKPQPLDSKPLTSADDRSRIPVIIGFGEVSPYGNARSRFEFETHGQLTVTSAFELAWFMGLIQYSNTDKYVGWVDSKTEEAVAESEVIERYGAHILDHTGIRTVEKDAAGFDPKALTVYSDIILEDDLLFPLESKAAAASYLNSENLELTQDKLTQKYFIKAKKGSTIKLPRVISHSRYVAGQIPTGFDASRFGVSKDLAYQIDRLSLFNFVASSEAFLSAGLTPDELSKEIHPSKIGNTQGSGMGGMTALNRLYHDWKEDKERKGDVLQETLISTIPAWITQSFTGGYGPSINPVAACATAVVSLSAAFDLITSGRADLVVAGGFDDLNPEGMIGFADMAATASTDEMLAKGIDIKKMSRPNDSRRGGFIEAQGGGTMLVTTLEKAVSMGLPIYAVLGFTATHSDGYNTSIPAPGLGLLSIARGGNDSPLGKALSRFGMTADDITVVSKHDTSTGANDPNESELHHLIQKKLGRREGNPLIVHSQKSLLGHSKGGSGAWAANAAVQMLSSGTVPGNRNLEDVDNKMKRFNTLSFTDETIELGDSAIRSVIITSLGFGHIGGAALFIHSSYVLSHLSVEELSKYRTKLSEREKIKIRREWMAKMGKEPYFKAVSERKYKGAEEEAKFLLD
ncbi:MAG: hypothetical protein COV46_02365 [Deltaproteobacteria bacterium CG11_big_fil_rev_8_21_14_0_20_49_13]|nr:MAG: hypothetical protein COV46_02365 [Deltaproteobacteria bacterium CG11_big_fil_rev_8_21_14_0_20_49_13]